VNPLGIPSVSAPKISTGGAVGAEELNAILWTERELLDGLHFAFETEQWVLSTGRIRWVTMATDRIREGLDALRRVEILRAAAADDVARDLGLPAAPSLSDIAGRMAEPWRSMLYDQRVGLLDATAAIQAVSASSMDELVGLRASLQSDGGGGLDQGASHG
jgi:FlgN protein